jgi:drug/metabolite transporter (DMT)-like permease
MIIFLIAVASIAISVLAQFSLKAGMSSASVRAALAQSEVLHSAIAIASNKFVLLGFFLYGVGAIVWLAVLSQWEVSKAYPLVGLGFVLAMAIGFVAGEQVSMARITGAVVICAGVFLVSRT